MEASLAQFGRAVRNVSRQLKEQAQEFISQDGPLEKALKEATANTNWGCTTTILDDIARSCTDYHEYNTVMRHIWEALAVKPKQWRRIFKTLTLIEYLLRHGPDRVIGEVRDYSYRIRCLTGFSYTEDGRERGAGIRDKAKFLVDLVNDPELLKIEREKARINRGRYIGIGAHGEVIGPLGINEAPYSYSTGRQPIDPYEAAEVARTQQEREKARRERQRQKAKAESAKSAAASRSPLDSEEGGGSGDDAGSSSSSGSGAAHSTSSHTSDVSSSSASERERKARRSQGRKNRKGASKRKDVAEVDFFNTDSGWGNEPVPPQNPSVKPPQTDFTSAFGSVFNPAAPPFPPPANQMPILANTAPTSFPFGTSAVFPPRQPLNQAVMSDPLSFQQQQQQQAHSSAVPAYPQSTQPSSQRGPVSIQALTNQNLAGLLATRPTSHNPYPSSNQSSPFATSPFTTGSSAGSRNTTIAAAAGGTSATPPPFVKSKNPFGGGNFTMS